MYDRYRRNLVVNSKAVTTEKKVDDQDYFERRKKLILEGKI